MYLTFGGLMKNKINQVLLNEYDWETTPDTSTTWRIGDGTAAFYNYILLCSRIY